MRYILIKSEDVPDIGDNTILMFRGASYQFDYKRYDCIFEVIGYPVEEIRTPIVFKYE